MHFFLHVTFSLGRALTHVLSDGEREPPLTCSLTHVHIAYNPDVHDDGVKKGSLLITDHHGSVHLQHGRVTDHTESGA